MSTGPADHRLRTFRTPFRRIDAHDRASFRLPYRILESSERKRAHETDDLHRRRRLPGHVRNPGRCAQERVARGRCGQRDAEPCSAHQARRSARAPRRVLGGHAARGHRRRRGRLRHRAGAGTRRHRGDAGHRAGRHGAGTARPGHRRARARVHADHHRPRHAHPPRGEESAPPGRPDEGSRRLRRRRSRALRREPPAPRRGDAARRETGGLPTS